MTDLRDKLLALDREGLEQEAARLGISVTESMSRAELIIAIEAANAIDTANAQHELGAIRSFREYRALICGLILVTIATIVWAVDTYLLLTDLHVVFFGVALSPILSLIYVVTRVLGGCLMAAALISLGFKEDDEKITPPVRAALIIVSVLITIIVIVSVPFLGNWLTMYP